MFKTISLYKMITFSNVSFYSKHAKSKPKMKLKCKSKDEEKPQERRNSLALRDPPIRDPEEAIEGKRKIEEIDVPIELENLKVLGDLPEEYRKRRVARIYQRSKNVMQQGIHNTKDWIMDFGTEQRWENPTMGWCSSGDSLSNFHMVFPSMCAAICFAERQGFRWVHEKPLVKKELKKSYSDNFTWNKRTRVSTK
uniref:NADH dehydrogenase [ubiquinone] iron-sulfur protein 4, mitochondrial n=1 Tax=Cuerna arida TaxID=1464854 RepID=A0A1B6GVE2_9HEMI